MSSTGGPTQGLTATSTGGPAPAQAPAQGSEAMKGLNIMDSTIIPEDMRNNLVSIAAQQVAGSGDNSAINNFNMPIKEFYAVRVENLDDTDRTSLNKNNVQNEPGIESKSNVTVLTSVTGNVQSGVVGNDKKQALKVLQLTREAIAAEVETDNAATNLRKGQIRVRLVGPGGIEGLTKRQGLNKLLDDATKGKPDLKFGANENSCTQVFFGYTKDADGKISAQGRVQAVGSNRKGGKIFTETFNLDTEDGEKYTIKVASGSGIMLKKVLEKLLEIKNVEVESPTVPSVVPDASSDNTQNVSGNAGDAAGQETGLDASGNAGDAAGQETGLDASGNPVVDEIPGPADTTTGTAGGKKNKSKRRKHLKKRMTKKKHRKSSRKNTKGKRKSKKA